MVANWTCLISELRSKALNRGVVIPEHPVADGHWHPCGVVGTHRKGGAYLLFEHLPHVALYANCAEPRVAEVWRPDGDRLLPYGNEPRVAAALALFSARTVLRAIEGASCRPCLLPRGRPRQARQSARKAAIHLLEALLANGGLGVREIRLRALEAGISWASIRRGATSLDVVATRRGFGQNGAWRWHLP
jgi:hypothetical protein